MSAPVTAMVAVPDTVLAGVVVDGLWRRLLAWRAGGGDLDIEGSLRMMPCTDLDSAKWLAGVWDGRLRCLRDAKDLWMVWEGVVFSGGGRGNTVEAEVREVFADAYKFALERVWIAFDEEGKKKARDAESKGLGKAKAEEAYNQVVAGFPVRFKKHLAFRDKLRSNAGQTALSGRMRDKMAASWREFDSDCRWLAFQNGVVDLWALRDRVKRGERIVAAEVELLPHSPERLITQVGAADFVPGAECPLWEWAFARSLPSAGVRGYVQRVLGGGLLGCPEKLLMNLNGVTNSGKSLLLWVAKQVWADYVRSVDVRLLLRGEQADSFELDKLRLARVVTATEPEKGGQWDDSLIKKLSGLDPQDTRGMYRDTSGSGGEWLPRFMLWVASNYTLHLHVDDRALMNRLRPVPFEVEMVEGPDAPVGRELMKELPARLVAEEMAGLAWWFFCGLVEWLNGGGAGSAPVEITRMRSDMSETVDTARRWVREQVEAGSLGVTMWAAGEIREQPWVVGSPAGVVTLKSVGGSGTTGLGVEEAFWTYRYWYDNVLGGDKRFAKKLAGFKESLKDLYGVPNKSCGVMRFPGLVAMVGTWKPEPKPSSYWTGAGGD